MKNLIAFILLTVSSVSFAAYVPEMGEKSSRQGSFSSSLSGGACHCLRNSSLPGCEPAVQQLVLEEQKRRALSGGDQFPTGIHTTPANQLPAKTPSQQR